MYIETREREARPRRCMCVVIIEANLYVWQATKGNDVMKAAGYGAAEDGASFGRKRMYQGELQKLSKT
ncbi:unnamed protein product [Absidia cylindrospora]